MKYERVTASFYRYRDSELLVAAGRIIAAMKTSTVYGGLTISLAEVESAYADYHEKLLKASGGGRLYKGRKRESKRRLPDLLQALAYQNNAAYNGDLSKLYQTGFPVLVKRRKGTAPDMPTQAFLSDGRVSGEIAFGFKPVGRDMLYEYCFAVGTDEHGHPDWMDIQTTTRSFKDYAGGFTPGQYVYFRVRARNGHGCSDWTQPIRLIVR